MPKPQVTPWFPGSVKPVRPGVYERGGGWSKWDGERWCVCCTQIEFAVKETDTSFLWNEPWRGLDREPSDAALADAWDHLLTVREG